MEPYFTRRFIARLVVLLIITLVCVLMAARWTWPEWWPLLPACALLILIIARAIQQGTNNVARKAREADDY